MKHLLLLTLLVCLFLQTGCAEGSESTTEAAREPVLTNSELTSQIEGKINSDQQLRAANLSVSADAEHSEATLTGTVESETLRTDAVNMAKAAHPGLTVNDKIAVKPREITRAEYTTEHARQEVEKAKAARETVGDTLDDAWIHAKIVAKLITHQQTPERKINVDVNNNTVTLRGTVNTAEEKLEAARIATETDGVKRVNNRLKVVKG